MTMKYKYDSLMRVTIDVAELGGAWKAGHVLVGMVRATDPTCRHTCYSARIFQDTLEIWGHTSPTAVEDIIDTVAKLISTKDS